MKRILYSALMVLALNAPTYSSAMPTSNKASVEVGFSPEGSAEDLVLQVISTARSDVKVLAYSFTSPKVVRALLDASKRGVKVAIVADSSNLTSKYSQSALGALVNAGIQVRTIDRYKIAHDKIIIVDGKHLQTGSFNYSKAAADSNSENVIVMWNSPDVVGTYARHWKSRWDQGTAFISRY